MPNGKPGDHPYTDIIVHGLDVYSPKIAGLVRQIDSICDEKTRHNLADRLFDQYNDFGNPDLVKLERELVELRDKLVYQTEERGYERPAD